MQEGERCKVSGSEDGENGGGESQGGVAETTTTLIQTMIEDMDYAIVPMVHVRLGTAIRVPPHQFVLQIDDDYVRSDPLLAHGLLEGWITPDDCLAFSCFTTSVRTAKDIHRVSCLRGLASPVSISIDTRSVSPRSPS